ncbi:hypothetical protein BC936DRAFT_139683, partial [Jimgerdemannia flammicorona]
MRDVLYTFFTSNCNASEEDLRNTSVLGMQSWGWTHETYGMDCKATNVLRLGRLSRTKMPNTLKTLAFLESFYALMSDVKPLTVMSLHFQVTLKTICDHANNVSLSHSRAHSKRKRKDLVQIDEQRWSFGELPTTPAKNSR